MPCKINKGLIPSNCTDISTGGVTGKFWLINQSRYLEAVIAEGTSSEIITITAGSLDPGEQFIYRFQVPPKSIITGNAYSSNNGVSGLIHLFTALISDMSMDQKNSLSSLFNMGRCLVIAETQAPKKTIPADDESPPYLLYGKRSGLEISNTDTNLSDQAAGNGILITLTTPTNSQLELNYPTNIQMTTTAIEALEAPGV